MPHDIIRAHQRLDRRPEATSFAVDDLLFAVRDGRVRVPPFQRKMRWDDSDRLALFDSVYRGFPIGTLLLWKRSAPAEQVEIGSVIIDAEARSDALWVVDGQQRVTTFVTAFLHESIRGERALHFDVTREEFTWHRLPPAEGARLSARFVPVFALLDTTRLMTWLLERAGELTTLQRGAALEAGKCLREYRVPGYIVESQHEELLLEIFERINRSGHRLTDVDVFHALSNAGRSPADARDFGRTTITPGWGALDEHTTLRALQALEGMDVHRALPEGLGVQRVRSALDRTRTVLTRVVSFLRDRAHVSHERLNPYALPVVVLARFFALFPDPTERTLILLRRWVWRGLCGLQFAGTGVQLQQHIRAVVADEEDASVQRLLRRSPDTADPSLYDLSDVRMNTARTKIHACVMASLEPRDLRTGASLSLRTFADTESFPFARLFVPAVGDGLAARLIHPSLAHDELQRLILDASTETLDSHGVTSAARDALARGDHDAFLTLRAQTLSAHFHRFFAHTTEWGADDSPPLAALAPDEDD
jgi:hypothetical protein